MAEPECVRYVDGHRQEGGLPVDGLGAAVARGDGFVWVRLHDPSREEMVAVADQLGLAPLAVSKAMRAHQRPKLDRFDELAILVVKPAAYAGRGRDLGLAEIAAFVAPRYVVTVAHGDTTVLDTVRERLDRDRSPVTPAKILYGLVGTVVTGYDEVLESVNADIDQVEEEVFGADAGDHAQRIYLLKRQVAELRRVVQPLAAALQTLADEGLPGTEERLTPYLRDMLDHALRAADAVEAADRLLSDVLEADMSRVSVRQNEIALRQNEVAARQNEDMRKISAWAAIGLVPTGIAGIYGMNFANMPELHWHYGYFAVLGLMAAVCALLYVTFRRNRWL